MSSESTCFLLQCDPSLISVVCSWTELSISEKFWETRKRVDHRKSKIVDGRSEYSTPENTGCKLRYEPHLFSEADSYTELSIWGKLGRSGKGSSPKKLKSLIEIRPHVCR